MFDLSLSTGKPSVWCLLLAKGFHFMTTPIFRVNFNANFQLRICSTRFRTLLGFAFVKLIFKQFSCLVVVFNYFKNELTSFSKTDTLIL